MRESNYHIGFISTRFAGTDGVSLETFKWAEILTEMGHRCFYFSGECSESEDCSMVVPEAHFSHPLIYEINQQLFERHHRTTATTKAVHEAHSVLRAELDEFVRRFELDLVIIENALSIPMNIPLGLALTELIAETQIAAIAHHHDFAWERERFSMHQAGDYLAAAFPPPMESILHVTINSYAARQLAHRTGMRSTIVPNVMDFEKPPLPPDGYADDLRNWLGIAPEESLLLQPTRVVPRKRIEIAVLLARWLEMPCSLVIPHQSGDEGSDYKSFIARLAESVGSKLIFAEDCFAPERGELPGGRKQYSLADAYQQADLITYPSAVEGFGNAFLEAIYYRKPLVMCSYEIFKTDIQPKGFDVVAFEGFLSELTLERVRTVLEDRELVNMMTARNYELGRKHFSYATLRKLLAVLIGRRMDSLY